MLTKIQGLALNKTPFQERNLVVKLLLRSGKKASVLFYGGRGGGAKQKSSVLELGTMVDVELRPGPRNSDLVVAKEWSPIWSHQNIRHDYRAFALTCLFLEIAEKVALDIHWPEANAEDEALPQGPFRVLSNALYQLEASLAARDFIASRHLLVFTGKLLAELGVYPQRGECVVCGSPLAPGQGGLLLADKGGIACLPCMNLPDAPQQESLLSMFIERLWHSKYADMLHFLKDWPEGGETQAASRSLLNYLMYQFQWDAGSFKSLQQI